MTAAHSRFFLALCVSLCLLATARAVMLLGTGDPNANTSAPTGDLAGSGWQYQGQFGGFLGTAIAPSWFVSAKHVAGSGPTFVFQGTTYNIVEARHDPYSDLSLFRVDGTFPDFAPLYAGSDEIGQRLVVFGRGTQRGTVVMKNGTPRGWLWGPGDGVQRWGENFVTDIVGGGPANEYVYATFDATGSPNEAHLSPGDSGGAVFLQENGAWKLAGISYAVDGPFYTTESGGGAFNAALHDARDFYYQDASAPGGYVLISAPQPVPTGFYATRISSKLPWIRSVIDPAGDVNGNGVSNLLEHAEGLNGPPPAGPGSPRAVQTPGFAAIVYRKLAVWPAPQYVIEQSTDMHTWSAVAAEETVVAFTGEVHIVQARVPFASGRIFLRVRITPPA